MAAQRRLPQYIANLKHGAWQQSGLKTPRCRPISAWAGAARPDARHLGLRQDRHSSSPATARRSACGCWSGAASSRAKARSADGYEVAASREALFEESDVLTVHLRLHDDTRGIVKLDDLLRMKPTALFVNTCRAELIEEDALVKALSHNRPGMAAVDVFESEPILQGHALLRLENGICTPHIGYVEQDSYELYFSAAFKNILAFDAGEMASVVNREALSVGRRR